MDRQGLLFPFTECLPRVRQETSSTFVDNMRLPVHRWFRFSAGFSADWVEHAIRTRFNGIQPRVFDPFTGSGTTLIAAEFAGSESIGIEAHPFLYRIAHAKLHYRSNPNSFAELIDNIIATSKQCKSSKLEEYPALIQKCYNIEALDRLDSLRQSLIIHHQDSPAWELAWLTLVGILRKSSHVNTAQWQYILPKKSKKKPLDPFEAFEMLSAQIYEDITLSASIQGPHARLILGDARICDGVPNSFAQLVICSPPYPNNYDYADATRLEMSFLQEISGWGDLQHVVRQNLVRSCTQHVREKEISLEQVLSREELSPICSEIRCVCDKLSIIRLSKGGKKNYHLMVASYFLDLAQVWLSLRRVCDSPSVICFVVGDSAPYGIYVPVIDWLGKLAMAAGFKSFSFDRTRDRNVKWKNRKHRVPLCEGRLWVEG